MRNPVAGQSGIALLVLATLLAGIGHVAMFGAWLPLAASVLAVIVGLRAVEVINQ